MVKTLIAIIILCGAVLYLPLWVQLGLFAIAVIIVRYPVALLIPAVFADAWYAPVRSFSFMNNKTVFIVGAMIILYYLVMRMTRIRERYGLEKE